MVVTFLVKHTLPLSHPETSRIYLTPSTLARDVGYGWSFVKTFFWLLAEYKLIPKLKYIQNPNNVTNYL